MQVLVVDDDVISLHLIDNALASSGYEVVTARNGREALGVLKERSIKLVIADWDMPEVSGIELCRSIRQRQAEGYVYIILVTSHSSPELVVRGLSAGADDFIAKPFNAAELVVRTQVGERILCLETRDLVIFTLAKLAEQRDPETGRHLERVRSYCRILATRLAEQPKYRNQIDAEYVRLVEATSPLHDIGKVGIPDGILTKPGKLTFAEFELMKTHTTLGAETLAAALESYPQARFLQFARDIAATHHEHYDGHGYPRGLSGEDIPLCGRIVALADAYDAMTSNRSYKRGCDHAVARTSIIAESGRQFDPDLVQAFLASEDEFCGVRQHYADETERLCAAGA